MDYAPENEHGVVFLFSQLVKSLGMHVESIRKEFPDCIAYEKSGRGERRIRIEFEWLSRNFKTHKHPTRHCDCIVCWKHNWPDCPKHIRIIELRNYYNHGFKVWTQPYDRKTENDLNYANTRWSLSANSSPGDLLLMYGKSPKSCITHLYIRKKGTNLKSGKASWRDGKTYYCTIQKISELKSPVFFKDLQEHKIIRTSYHVKKQLQGTNNITSYWPYLYDLIIERNPSLEKKLRKFSPERM